MFGFVTNRKHDLKKELYLKYFKNLTDGTEPPKVIVFNLSDKYYFLLQDVQLVKEFCLNKTDSYEKWLE